MSARDKSSFSAQLAKVQGRTGTPIDPVTMATAQAAVGVPGSTGAQAAAPAGFMNRLKNAAAYLITGVGPQNFFGPWQPIQPMADKPEQGVVGRQFDYTVGQNLNIQPRATETINFPTLRAFGDNYDLMRLAIETCKDQIESFEWEIVPVDEDASPDAFKGKIEELTEFWQAPDKEHSWAQWLRMLVEDLLVIDAISIFPNKNRGGGLYSLDLVDGGTITRLIDEYGRTPMPPNPAYRQVIKGIPAVNYTRDDLVYAVRNPRTNRLYGYSPVEQVLMTVNIAMRRQLHQLQYYTEGNVPEALISVPDNWTSQQIKEFQLWWDSLMEGNTAARRHMKFIPKTENIVFPKEGALKDDYDDWLARIICWAFSIPPTALMKQMNRASSEQIAETAKEEGQLPRLRWIAALINDLNRRFLGVKDVKFQWKLEQEIDPVKKAQADLFRAQRNQIYVAQKVMTPDEVREDDLDKDPLTDEEREKAWPAPPPMLATPNAAKPGDETAEPNQAVAGNQAPGNKPINDDKPPAAGGTAEPVGKYLGKAVAQRTAVAIAVEKREGKLTTAINKVLAKHAAKVMAAVRKAYDAKKLAKDDKYGEVPTEDEIREMVASMLSDLDLEGISVDVVDELTPEIEAMFRMAGAVGVAQVGMAETEDITSHLDQAALDYAKGRAAELVTKLTETTRDNMRTMIADAIENGDSADDLADSIEGAFAFSPSRAETIARTELATAHVQGNVDGWRQSDQVAGKQWILGDNHDDVDECDECANAGIVGLDADFIAGYDFPPAHPRCCLPDTVVAAFGVAAHFGRWFEGEVIEITFGGKHLTVTPNHPVLTVRGWVAAGDLRIGEHLFECVDPAIAVTTLNPDDYYMPTRFDEVPSALLMAGGMASGRMPAAAEAFHGDGSVDGEVDVVWAARALTFERVAERNQRVIDQHFSIGQRSGAQLPTASIGTLLVKGEGLSSDSGVRSADNSGSLLWGALPVQSKLHLGEGPNLQAVALEEIAKRGTVTVEALCEVYGGLAGLIQCVEITDIRKSEFAGHVHNLSTSDEWYFANGIITHNCVCDVVPVLAEESDQSDTETEQ